MTQLGAVYIEKRQQPSAFGDPCGRGMIGDVQQGLQSVTAVSIGRGRNVDGLGQNHLDRVQKNGVRLARWWQPDPWLCLVHGKLGDHVGGAYVEPVYSLGNVESADVRIVSRGPTWGWLPVEAVVR